VLVANQLQNLLTLRLKRHIRHPEPDPPAREAMYVSRRANAVPTKEVERGAVFPAALAHVTIAVFPACSQSVVPIAVCCGGNSGKILDFLS